MRFSNFVILVLWLFCLSCSNKDAEETVPTNILSIDAFSKVLTDFSLAESAANLNVKTAAKPDSVYAFNPLTENKVRKTLFDSSLNFYCRHSHLYKKVYEQVLARLKVLESKKLSVTDTIKIK